MSLVPPVNSSATYILQQSKINPMHLDKSASPNDNILAVANGIDAREEARDVKTADDYWGVFQTDPTQMKAKLFMALGEAFGLDMKDFKSISSFGNAIRAKLEKMKTTPEGRQTLLNIEKKLGLAELGISLDTLIEAVINPEGAANDKLEAALEKQSTEEDELAEAVEILGSAKVDGNGLYSPTS
ncbi:MAG: hypothetical protein COB78_01180 [Hyphomicrobiales bacterium]|nr:MAG: hypothetical protein COB78_01180 [Hyphomicrobiales bacterium]